MTNAYLKTLASLPPLPSLPELANPEVVALDAFKLATAEQISKILEIPLAQAYEGVESGKTGKNVTGDFTVAVPRYRIKGTPPAEVAKKLVSEFKPNDFISSCSMNGLFVSFVCNPSTLCQLVLEQINQLTHLTPQPVREVSEALQQLRLDPLAEQSRPEGLNLLQRGTYGTNSIGSGKSILIDFSSPNIAKPFHAGHLRSTIIGAFLGNLYEANGYDVVRMNYLGDWGKQFGILAVGFEKYGSEQELAKDAITHLYDVYVKINKDGSEKTESGELTADAANVHDRAREFFLGMENGDEKSISLWKKFRDLSIVKYKETYARLNIYFDIYWGESQVSQKSQEEGVAKMGELGLTEEADGALLVNLEKYKLGKTVIKKKDGTSVYITRDIGGAVERWEKYKFDKSIYVVASQQDQHLAQLFKIMDLMEYPWAKRMQHINFGMVLGMSTRKGTAVFLDQILNESRDVMHEQMKKNEAKYAAVENPEETSDKLGITAVKIQDMAAKRVNNYKFEWSRMTSFEGDTGPYLQYAHVRLSSVERRNAQQIVLPAHENRAESINTKLLAEDTKALEIVSLLANYPDVVKQALKSLEPATIVTYAFRLCHAISSAWETLIVRGQPDEVALARLWLFVSAKDVLASAMRLLTLEPLEHM